MSEDDSSAIFTLLDRHDTHIMSRFALKRVFFDKPTMKRVYALTRGGPSWGGWCSLIDQVAQQDETVTLADFRERFTEAFNDMRLCSITGTGF